MIRLARAQTIVVAVAGMVAVAVGKPGESAGWAARGEIKLELGDGPDKGSHSMDTSLLSCVSQPPLWRVRARDPAASGLSQIELLVDPLIDGNPRFMLLGLIGRGVGARAYVLRVPGPYSSEGGGTFAARDDGAGAILEVRGQASSGVPMAIIIHCATVRLLPPPARSQ
ncbi:MAG: hypothetical protein HY644_05925 [Acidobacteria bacterium]|nr:hypothetical protein [Acidobacteriota bacterium]